jgi:hypothetical protein
MDKHTTIMGRIRAWLARFTRTHSQLERYDRLMARLRGKVVIGRKLSRDEMNER